MGFWVTQLAKLGCSRCLMKFSGSVGSMDYSGFEGTSGYLEMEQTIENIH